MPRRRLRLVTSSDEEEEPPHQIQPEEDNIDEELQRSTFNFENVNLNSSNPISNVPLDISDDDFIVVSDHLSSPSPPPSNSTTAAESVSNPSEASDCPITGFLSALGLRLRKEWMDSCIRGLEAAVPGFSRLESAAKAKLCFEQFMHSDMNYTGAGLLPANVNKMHLVDLEGPFVLQVDEIVNISCPLKGRYQNASSGLKRCLKLSMTDGVQRVFGMEYRPIKHLEVLAPAGLKVAVCNVTIRHGILMLVPEVIEVLGGLVEELDAARQRLVVEVNKPPRGKRTRTGEVLPLATRATIAAWPPNGVNVSGHTPSPVSQVAIPFQAGAQGNASGTPTNQRTREEPIVPIQRQNYEPDEASTTFSNVDDIQLVDEDEVEHLSALTRDREAPFSYLASLSAKWAAMKDQTPNVQGKIKCFLTGVKGFQYKQRTAFDLRVYVDDGSLISEILIDHNVVQKGIGYSPEEVTAALVSSDMKRVNDMKETLKQFQVFLVNFEGMMVVQVSEASPVPLAIEMNQGCSVADAWGLLRRLRPSSSAQQRWHTHLEAVNLSP